MSVDVFGRSLKSKTIVLRHSSGLQLTNDGQYDAQARRICNLGNPIDEQDAVTLSTVKKLINAVQANVDQNREYMRIILRSLYKKEKVSFNSKEI